MTENTYRYGLGALQGDYLRAAAGLTLTGGPLVIVETGRFGMLTLSLLALIFLSFGVRTVMRHGSRIHTDDEGLSVEGPIKKTIAWRDVRSIGLRYYTTMRSGGTGWMQLKLKGGGTSISVESTVDKFRELVGRVVRETKDRGIDMDPTTINNMKALGVMVSSDSQPMGANERSSDSQGP